MWLLLYQIAQIASDLNALPHETPGLTIVMTPVICGLPLQSLCDDDLVHKEKIGASNYFWCSHPAAVSCQIRPAAPPRLGP